ncbi:MAG: DUF3575 domain-containing protein [Bacteroidaceae bacterium]|nr:DUF3575 domain-containing protein [Bacteroidaceae bacterium]MBQ5657880.1 DUF3575 domain-containing protein [Bacteroidaceae bacterium]
MTTVYCRADKDTVTTQGDHYSLYYYRDRVDLQEDYLDNALQMVRIRDILARSPRIDSIAIYAYASPEGAPHRNDWLARRRAEVARDFILANLPNDSVLLPQNIILHPMGENWEGLYEELDANYHLMNRDRVMRIMRADIPTETKKWRLKQLDNGFTYNWIIRHHMPALRVATWLCVYQPIPEFVPDTMPDISVEMPTLPELEPLPVTEVPRKKKTILALKTNLLYDALSLVNYSIEVPIGERFSALWYHQFPWWTWGQADNQYCIRFLSIGGEGRWWFKPMPRPQMGKSVQRDRLMGHFVGVYAESGKWDFEWGRDICHQGEHWSVGLSYGYSMPLGRRLNMEFSLSLGYASIAYRGYTPSENYEILWRDLAKQGRWHYFGPTKVQVSLVVPITMQTKRKGGAR